MTTYDDSSKGLPLAIMGISAALMIIGVVMIASASASLDRPLLSAGLWHSVFARQLMFAAMGFVTMVAFSRIGPQRFAWRSGWWQPTIFLLLITGACLVAVLVPGIGLERNGARRWLPLGPPDSGINFQPSELAKLGLVVFLAAFLAQRGPRVRSALGTLLPAVLVIGLIGGLVGREDFGTAALLGLVSGAMLLAAGCRIWHLVVTALPALAGAAYLVCFEPYRLERVTSFFDIWKDPQGSGYHPIQSLATIASGGWFGRGLGAGVQKYGYLPASQTDFIFSVICEETGAVGGLAVILLFIVLILLGLRVMRRAGDAQTRLVALGVTALVGLQAAINIAVVTVVAPTKGIALPFVSAGGSGIIFLGALVGLLAGAAQRAAVPVPERERAVEAGVRPPRGLGPVSAVTG